MVNRIKVAIASAVLTLRQQGWSFRRIARELGVHRETVARCVRLAEAESKPANPPPGADGAPGPKPAKDPPPGNSGPVSLCEPFRKTIGAKVDQGLSAKRIWQDLAAESAFPGSYTSVKRFVRRLAQASPLPFRRMECAPGEEAQVDFARGAPVEAGDGRRRSPHVLRVVLSHSRKGYSEGVWRQTTEDFIRALENAFWAFGGVPRTVTVDNLRAAVSKADWYDPDLNPKVRDFARHYGTVVLPTKPCTPRHKGKVENGVKYLRDNALKGRVFPTLADQNRHLVEWEAQVADHRIHGTTKQQVRQRFDSAERPALLALPATRFPFYQEAARTVNRDGHVEVDKAYYSVPPEYLGCRVWARWDGRLVRVLNDRFEQIAVHVKHDKGRFSTDPKHIASEKISGVERGAEWLLQRVSRIGPHAFRWARAMLDARGIEGVRVLQGLLSMTHQHSADDLERACDLAFSHGAWRLQALRDLMKRPSRQTQFVQSHPLIRPLDDYGRYLRVSFQPDGNNGNDHGEFIAFGAPGGKEKGLGRPQALPTVQPPASALGSLSSGALSSGPASESLIPQATLVNLPERNQP